MAGQHAEPHASHAPRRDPPSSSPRFATFGQSEISAFTAGVSALTGVPQASLEVNEIFTVDDIAKFSASARRRLHQDGASGAAAAAEPAQGGVRVSFGVAGLADPAFFSSMLIAAKVSGELEQVLKVAGLSALTGVGAITVTPVAAPPWGETPGAGAVVVKRDRKVPAGTIVGAAVGGTLGLCLLLCLVAFLVRHVWGWTIACIKEQKKKQKAKKAAGTPSKKKKKGTPTAALPRVAGAELRKSSGSGSGHGIGGKFTPSGLPFAGKSPSRPQLPKRTLSGEFLAKEGRILVQKWVDSPIDVKAFRSPLPPRRDGSGRSMASTAYSGPSPAQLTPEHAASGPAALSSTAPRRALFPPVEGAEGGGEPFDRHEKVLQALADAPPARMYDPRTGELLQEGQQAPAGGRLTAPKNAKFLGFLGRHLGTAAGTAAAGPVRPPAAAAAQKRVVIAEPGGGVSADITGGDDTGSSEEEEEDEEGEEEEEELDEEASVGGSPLPSYPLNKRTGEGR